MEPRSEQKSRFRIEKLEDRIAPSILDTAVDQSVQGSVSGGFDAHATVITGAEGQSATLPGHGPVGVPPIHTDPVGIPALDVQAGPVHVSTPAVPVLAGQDVPGFTLIPASPDQTATASVDSVTVGTGNQHIPGTSELP